MFCHSSDILRSRMGVLEAVFFMAFITAVMITPVPPN